MSKAKYIITFFIFLAVLLFIGESYTFYLENFQDTYTQVGYFLPAGDSEQLMNKTILEKADEYEAPVFALEKNQNGIFSRKITIYGNDEIREKLKSDWNIDDEPKKSFFSGTTVFEFQPFEKASEKIMQNCWYPYSSQDEIYEMVYQGMEKYSGAFRNDPISSTSKIVVAGVWGLALLVVILLTLYDISYGKKEQGIRVILGEDNTKMKWRKVLSDFWGILISFGLALLLLIPFTTPEFEIELTLCSFFVIIIINSAIVLWKMSINRISIIRESLSHRVLDMSMLMKGIIATLSIIILSITIGLCVEGVKLYIQRDYYITQNDYVHVEIDYPFVDEKIEYSENAIDGVDTLDTTDQISDDFLRYSYQKLDCRLLYNYSYKDVAPKYGVRYIYANLRGLEQYKNQIEDWDRLISNEGNYILISDQMNKDEVVNELLSIGNVLNISNDNLAGVYTYKHGLSVIAEGKQADEYNYTYCIKNPVIILDTYNVSAK